jgi:hypothetical protein
VADAFADAKAELAAREPLLMAFNWPKAAAVAATTVQDWATAQTMQVVGGLAQYADELLEMLGVSAAFREQDYLLDATHLPMMRMPVIGRHGVAGSVRLYDLSVRRTSTFFANGVAVHNCKSDPSGGRVTVYLLEKSRVINPGKDQRNFHFFYQFLSGASQEVAQYYQLYSAENFFYLNQSGCYTVPGVDDVKDYAEVLNGLNVLGFDQTEQNNLHAIIAGILHLGNVAFHDNGKGGADVSYPEVLQLAATYFQVDPAALIKAICFRIINTGGGGGGGRRSTYNVPQNPEQAGGARDALARDIYSKLFDWVVDKVNIALNKYQMQHTNVIGILDIYGFEIFEDNSFEQFCIAAGTPVQLADGTAVPIEQMVGAKQRGLVAAPRATADGVRVGVAECVSAFANGTKQCVELTLQDGRTLVCTPDHRVLTADGEWVEAQDLKLGQTRVAAAAHVAPCDERTADEADFALVAGSLRLSMSGEAERAKTLAFARLLGAGAGRRAASFTLGSQVDVDAVLRDIALFNAQARVVAAHGGVFDVTVLEGALVAALCAVAAGTVTEHPAFMASAPRAVQREYVAALFGAHGCAPQLSQRGELCHVSFVRSCAREFVVQLNDMLRDCGVNVEQTPSIGESSVRAKKSKTDAPRANEIALHLHDSASFAAHVGFRFCSQKQARLAAAVAFWADAAKATSATAWLASVGAASWFDELSSASAADAPSMSLLVVGRRACGARAVYDLTVPATTSFVANGVAVHNCINYVNEKLQQYFIELTLKAEQEEYQKEGIQWTPIPFFNNQVVVELIEGGKGKAPGIFSLLDDVCATVHAETGGKTDQKALEKIGGAHNSHPHFKMFSGAFGIKHYAGDVVYNINSFCDKNKDTLFPDIVETMQCSQNRFIVSLFPNQGGGGRSGGRRPGPGAEEAPDHRRLQDQDVVQCADDRAEQVHAALRALPRRRHAGGARRRHGAPHRDAGAERRGAARRRVVGGARRRRRLARRAVHGGVRPGRARVRAS